MLRLGNDLGSLTKKDFNAKVFGWDIKEHKSFELPLFIDRQYIALLLLLSSNIYSISSLKILPL